MGKKIKQQKKKSLYVWLKNQKTKKRATSSAIREHDYSSLESLIYRKSNANQGDPTHEE